ncbi:MAG: cyclic pyranopterin monophosphate synthase MoaC [Opitutales bacterium]
MSQLSHIDDATNQPTMVDVSNKAPTQRMAKARGYVYLPTEVFARLENGDIATKKGPVFHTAIIAGTQAAKRTSDWIPFCHPLILESIKVFITPEPEESRVKIESVVKLSGKTGVEMEALTAVSAAALTLYDMCKALSQDMRISDIELVEKTGGKSDISKG